MPDTPSPGFGISLPLGLSLHGALLVLLLYPSFAVHEDELPTIDAYRIRLFAPPAAALRQGDPMARPDPEDPAITARDTSRSRLAAPLARVDLLQVLEAAEIPMTFGAENGIPEGLWDGLEFGKPEGVVGGIPGGVQGGQIGGLREEADPVLPPPDEPPVALSMPRPRFPKEALRDGIRGRVVLSPDNGTRDGRGTADSAVRTRTRCGSHQGRRVGVEIPRGQTKRPAGGLAQ